MQTVVENAQYIRDSCRHRKYTFWPFFSQHTHLKEFLQKSVVESSFSTAFITEFIDKCLKNCGVLLLRWDLYSGIQIINCRKYSTTARKSAEGQKYSSCTRSLRQAWSFIVRNNNKGPLPSTAGSQKEYLCLWCKLPSHESLLNELM